MKWKRNFLPHYKSTAIQLEEEENSTNLIKPYPGTQIAENDRRKEVRCNTHVIFAPLILEICFGENGNAETELLEFIKSLWLHTMWSTDRKTILVWMQWDAFYFILAVI